MNIYTLRTMQSSGTILKVREGKDQSISSYILEQLLDFSEYQEKNIISCKISNYTRIFHHI